MVDEVADALRAQRDRLGEPAPTSLVFPGEAGGYADPSALRRRYVQAVAAAGLPPLRFHDLRHTFGSLAINHASIVQVQAWMGHADIKTTMRYLHHKSRADEAKVLSQAFRTGGRVSPWISQILFSTRAETKLGARSITPQECLETLANGPLLWPNPHAGQPGRLLLIGRTNGGRSINLVVETTIEPTDWTVITGWESTVRERKIFEKN